MDFLGTSPLTFGQLSLWRSMEDLPPQRLTVANLTRVWEIPPGRTASDVEAAWNRLVERHEGLRTSYRLTGPRGIEQVIHAARAVTLPQRPVTGDVTGQAQATAGELASLPFDLGSAPLWRLALLTEDGRPVQLVLSIHHMAADRASVEVLHEELTALLSGKPLSEPAPTCRELAAAQFSPAWRTRRTQAIAYWEKTLAAAPRPAPLPGPDASMYSGTLSSAAVRGEAGQLAASLGVSVQSLLLSLFCRTLSATRRSTTRPQDQDRLLVALMAGNRVDPAMRTLVSSVNQLSPLLFDSGNGDFASVTRQVHTRTMRAYRHGCFDIDEATEAGRPYGVNGLGEGFDQVFNFLSGGVPTAPEGSGPDAWRVEVREEGRPLRYPLYFQAGYDDSGLWCGLTIRRDVSGEEARTAVLREIRTFLEEFHAELTKEIREAVR
ncbi:hypothetical protein N566_04850 [Streptomycetaceae bacterium MP113-05]|nr:hypothetical protein N566_04850 [Streptomycetaceae bacterium MP113-05]